MPSSRPAAGFDRIDPDKLEVEGLILLEDGHCLREHSLAVCGLEPPKLGEEGFAATSLHTLVQMVGSGLAARWSPPWRWRRA